MVPAMNSDYFFFHVTSGLGMCGYRRRSVDSLSNRFTFFFEAAVVNGLGHMN